MSIPVPPTNERMSLDANQRVITRSLLTVIENLQGVHAFVITLPSDPDALLEPPYSYTADEAYALRRWADLAAAYADIFEAGGTLSAADAGVLRDLTHKSAGMIVFSPTGM